MSQDKENSKTVAVTFPAIRKFDFNSAEMKQDIAKCINQQKQILRRLFVSQEDLRRQYTI